MKTILRPVLAHPPLQLALPYYHAWRRKARAWRAVNRIPEAYPPILVYQMGKVGSSTVFSSLQAAHLPNPVFHLHHLSDDLPRHWDDHVKAGNVPVPYHLYLSQALRSRLRRRNKPHCKIISLVRDPIAREVSILFEVPHLLGADVKDETGAFDAAKAIGYLNEKLREPDAFDYVVGWFDRELKAAFGIDVFARPFDRTRGWTVIRGDHAEALILRVENLSELFPKVVPPFVGASTDLPLVVARVREKTPDGAVYKQVKAQVKLDRSICARIYASRFVQHFYDAETVASWMRKWSAG